MCPFEAISDGEVHLLFGNKGERRMREEGGGGGGERDVGVQFKVTSCTTYIWGGGAH